jgi:hypothetical protein
MTTQTTNTTTPAVFEVGKTYLYCWNFDMVGEPVYGHATITKRTAKFVAFKDGFGRQYRSKINGLGRYESCKIRCWTLSAWQEAQQS